MVFQVGALQAVKELLEDRVLDQLQGKAVGGKDMTSELVYWLSGMA